MTFLTVVIQTYDNNWIFGIVFGIFVYAGMGILLPELDKSIENSAQQGTIYYTSKNITFTSSLEVRTK